jgi:hypothetical protein
MHSEDNLDQSGENEVGLPAAEDVAIASCLYLEVCQNIVNKNNIILTDRASMLSLQDYLKYLP